MQPSSRKTIEQHAVVQTSAVTPEAQAYIPPAIYPIGQSGNLLQGSGRHKNDDTGSRGFTVDQH